VLTIAAFGLCLVLIRVTGRDLHRLSALRIRRTPLVLAALAAQTLIVSVWTTGSPGLHQLIHIASYVALGVALWSNRSIPRLWIVAVGVGANAAAITANHGTMPASPVAMAAAGMRTVKGFANSGVVGHPHLAWLGDEMSTPRWLPLHNVLSIGDILIVVGSALVVWTACRPPLAAETATTDRPTAILRRLSLPPTLFTGRPAHIRKKGRSTG
jgi:hypothetical protein